MREGLQYKEGRGVVEIYVFYVCDVRMDGDRILAVRLAVDERHVRKWGLFAGRRNGLC